jgi:hypothetical protein
MEISIKSLRHQNATTSQFLECERSLSASLKKKGAKILLISAQDKNALVMRLSASTWQTMMNWNDLMSRIGLTLLSASLEKNRSNISLSLSKEKDGRQGMEN